MKAQIKLKAYMVYDGEPMEGCTLAFATSATQAKVIAMNAGWYDEYIRMRAVRKPEMDACTEGRFEPWYAEGNDELPNGFKFFSNEYSYDDTM